MRSCMSCCLDTVTMATHLNDLAVCDQIPNAGPSTHDKVASICGVEALIDLCSFGRILHMKTS